jgi:hypothetical protein
MRSLEAAETTAQTTGVTAREAAHIAALGAWVAGDFVGATARWEAILIEAKWLLDERLEYRPRNVWGWRHLSQVLGQLDDNEMAAAARERAGAILAEA